MYLCIRVGGCVPYLAEEGGCPSGAGFGDGRNEGETSVDR